MAGMNMALFYAFLLFGELYGQTLNKEAQEENNNSIKESLESKAISAYRNACHRLQNFADWMTIVLRVKSMWTRSVARDKQDRNLPSAATGFSLNEPGISRMRREDKSSCASLKNLHVSALTYVQWQAELMRVKALVGGNFLKNSMSRLNESAESLKILGDRVKSLDIVNRTSKELLENLKMGVQGLSLQLQEERIRTQNLIKEIGMSRDFLPHLHSIKDNIMNQLQELSETSEGLRKAEFLIQKGELLQVMGHALEKQIAVNSLTDTGVEKQNESFNPPP